MKLRYLGRQGMCRYYWRVFRDGYCTMYAKVDGGTLQPVAGSPVTTITAINRKERSKR